MPKRKAGSKTSPLYQLFGFLFLLVGVFLVLNLADIEYTKYQTQISSKITNLKDEPINASQFLNGEKIEADPPERILLPKQGIDIKVIEAPVINGYWETSDLFASHGQGSASPGQKGNMVIFAHARSGLFYNLKDVKTGDSVYVFTKDKWKMYKINKITSVFPNQVEVIAPTSSEVLTLYTCTGFADEKRLIVTAVPQI